MDNKYIIYSYLAFITIIAVIITVYDKSAAIRGKQRIPERTLLFVGLIGGALPMVITMKGIRHKTKHLKFMLGLPAEFILQLAIIAAVVYLTKR